MLFYIIVIRILYLILQNITFERKMNLVIFYFIKYIHSLQRNDISFGKLDVVCAVAIPEHKRKQIIKNFFILTVILKTTIYTIKSYR